MQQKLRTDDAIKAFAYDIVSQSGAYLKLNNDQIRLHLRNNEADHSPTNVASINQKDVLDFDIYQPPIELQNQFATFVEQTDKSKFAVQQSLERLETLKKSLMQKYFG